jgi:hypothetical protein
MKLKTTRKHHTISASSFNFFYSKGSDALVTSDADPNPKIFD